MLTLRNLSLALSVYLLARNGVAWADVFEAGADVSHLRFFEERGTVYRDSGVAKDALVTLRERGLTCARLRLFTSSPEQAQADPYNRINNLEYTIPLAQRVKKAGLRLLLDFHYSDTWADPGKQAKPSAWANLAFDELERRMYEYNRDCIRAFSEAGAMPDQVQVGNEITSGLLWPDGRIGGSYENPTQWQQLGRLLKAAIRGIKEASGTNQPTVLVHIDRGGDWNATRWYFDGLRTQQVEFDAIGLSYYPFWHGTFEALRTCLEGAVGRYGKPIAIVETAFPWSNSADVQGFPATPEGQTCYLVELAKIVKGLPQNRGAGIYWWGAEYRILEGVNTAGFEYRSFFDKGGNVLPVASTLGRLAVPALLKTTRLGTNVTLTWPLSGAGWSLMATTNLAFPDSWAPLGNNFADDGYGFNTSLPLQEAASCFYRLQSN